MKRLRCCFGIMVVCLLVATLHADDPDKQSKQAASEGSGLRWQSLPDLPDPLGLAGPIVGVDDHALIVAGGANFPTPVWQHDKVWHDTVFALSRKSGSPQWRNIGRLPRNIAYAATVTIDDGILVMGGNDQDQTFADVWLLKYDDQESEIEVIEFPSLPEPCAYGSAARIDDIVYLASGQSGATLDTAMNHFWSLDLSKRGDSQAFRWEVHPRVPFSERAFACAAAQFDGSAIAFYLISGRRQQGNDVEFLTDVWKYRPDTRQWIREADSPTCVMAGAAIASGERGILVLSGADGSLFHMADTLKDQHPGFPKKSYRFDTIADRWTELGETPQNQVTTTAVRWQGAIVLPSGETRPRVRTRQVWQIKNSGE